MEPDLELNEWTNRLLACCFEVHTEVGPGFPEAFYQNALERELRLQNIEFQRQVPVTVRYKGAVIGEGKIDLIVGARIIVEIKCAETISSVHVAQALTYLKATGLKICLIVNFKVA